MQANFNTQRLRESFRNAETQPGAAQLTMSAMDGGNDAQNSSFPDYPGW